MPASLNVNTVKAADTQKPLAQPSSNTVPVRTVPCDPGDMVGLHPCEAHMGEGVHEGRSFEAAGGCGP